MIWSGYYKDIDLTNQIHQALPMDVFDYYFRMDIWMRGTNQMDENHIPFDLHEFHPKPKTEWSQNTRS